MQQNSFRSHLKICCKFEHDFQNIIIKVNQMKASSLWMKKQTIADMDDERKKKKRKTEPEQTVTVLALTADQNTKG